MQLNDDGTNLNRLSSAAPNTARIPLRPSMLDKLETYGNAILQQTGELTKRFNTLLSPTNQKSMMNAVDQVSNAALALQTIPQQLEPTFARLPTLIEQGQKSLATLNTLSADANKLIINLDTLTRTANQVSTSVELETLPRIHNFSDEARSSIHSLNRTLRTLNESPQSLLFGLPQPQPGPGEAGFATPTP